MILNDYRQMLARMRWVFETKFKQRASRAECGAANAVPVTQTVQPERRSSPRRDGTCPWGTESRRDY